MHHLTEIGIVVTPGLQTLSHLHLTKAFPIHYYAPTWKWLLLSFQGQSIIIRDPADEGAQPYRERLQASTDMK